MLADDEITFLRARLDEEEAAARDLIESEAAAPHWHEMTSGVLVTGAPTFDDAWDGVHAIGDSRITRFIADHDPARARREVAVWRRLLLEYSIPPGTDAAYGGAEREAGYRLALSAALKAKIATYDGNPVTGEPFPASPAA